MVPVGVFLAVMKPLPVRTRQRNYFGFTLHLAAFVLYHERSSGSKSPKCASQSRSCCIGADRVTTARQ